MRYKSNTNKLFNLSILKGFAAFAVFGFLNKKVFKRNLVLGLLTFVSLFFYNQINGQTTFTRSISQSSDDAEETGTDGTYNGVGFVNLTSPDIELVRDDANPTAGSQKVGLRFQNIQVPKGAIINNAYITFRAIAPNTPNTNNGVNNLVIKGQAADDPATFVSTTYDVSKRTKTSAFTNWTSLPAWTTNTNYNTPSVAAIVQELVTRNGWNSGNSMVFLIEGSGSRNSESWDNAGTNQPILTIEYSTIQLSATVTDVSIPQGQDGAIDLSVSGGVAPFTYLWSNGATTQDLSNIIAGIYTVTVTGANGATEAKSFNVIDGLVYKQLYLTGPGQLMDRISPEAVSESIKSSEALYSPQIGVLNSEYRVFNNANTFYGIYNSPDGPNRMLIVSISVRNRNDIFTTNVRYNDVPMTLVSTEEYGQEALVYIYRLIDPPVGDHYLEVDFNSNVTRAAVIGIATLHGVHQTNPTGTPATAVTNAGNISINVPSAAGDLVMGVVSRRNASSSFTTSQTQRWNAFLNETRGAGNSAVATSSSTTLSWTAANGSWAAIAGVAIKPSGGNATTTFTQSPAMCSDFIIKAGTIKVENYINILDGTMSANPNVIATLRFNANNIITLTNPVYNTTTGLMTWTGNLASDVTIPAGSAISLDVTTEEPLVEFQVQFDHSTKPSLIEFTTSTFIDIPTLAVYDAAYPGGNVITSAQNGSSVYVRATASDPFGFSDINGLSISTVNPSSGPFEATQVATSGCTKTYQYQLTTPSTQGDISISARAREGYEGTVTYTKSIDFSLCPITVTNTVTPLTTCSGQNGIITLNVTGPSGPYTWAYNRTNPIGSASGSGLTMSDLNSGTYVITVTSVRGCTGTTTATLTQPVPPDATASIVNTTCNLGGDGTITQTVTGSFPPFNYVWSDGGPGTKDRTNLAAGTYFVTITNAGSCQTIKEYLVGQPLPLSVTTTLTQPTCSTGGNIGLSMSGGGSVGPYNYTWTRLSPVASGSGSGTSITNLIQGSYTITVTSSLGCTGTSPATLTLPPSPVANAFINQVTCFGSSNGIINQSITSGTAPFTYLWSDGSTLKNRISLIAGNYTVTVTDAKDCQTSKTYVVSQPTDLALNATALQPSCSNSGNITLAISGGNTPYMVDWQDISGTENIKDRIGLSQGSYQVTISDKNGCTKSSTTVIGAPNCDTGIDVCISSIPVKYTTDPSSDATEYIWTVPSGAIIVSGQGSPEISVNWSNVVGSTGLICVRKSNDCGEGPEYCVNTFLKSISVSATAASPVCTGSTLKLFGNGGTSYKWSGPNGFMSESENPIINNINSTNSGTYTVTVTNAEGCFATAQVSVSVGTAPTSTAIVYNASCGSPNGFIDLSVSGGTTPYQYLWSDGKTFQDNFGLAKGNYNVTVTGNNGCTATRATSVGEVNGPSIVLTPNSISCFGASTGNINASLSGGTTPYTYYWSNGSTTQNLSNVKAGQYSVTVVDFYGCADVETATITQSNAIKVDRLTSNVSCFGNTGAAIDLTVTGGQSPYTYLWNNGLTSQDRTNLSAGNYIVTVTDGLGCTQVHNYTISQPSAPLQLSLFSTPTTCDDLINGVLNLTVTGGTVPYSYTWSSTDHPSFSASTQHLANLDDGDYTVIVTDQNGCTSSSTTSVSLPESIVLAFNKKDLNCYKSSNGFIDLTVTGGNPSYTYLWSNGSTDEDLSYIQAGNYSVTVIDGNGCQRSSSIIVNEPSDITANAVVGHLTCSEGAGGSIDLTISGGTSPYQYQWSNGATTQDVTDLFSGNHSVTITDANSCYRISAYNVESGVPFITNEFVTNVSCSGGSDGVIDFTVKGGAEPYTFIWSNGATTEDINNLSEGAYQVTFTDANLCSSSSLIIVGQPNQMTLLAQSSDQSCEQSVDGSITLSVYGGIEPYKYEWSNGFSTQHLQNINQGSYQVTVTDYHGCTSVASASVFNPEKITIGGSVTPNCPNMSNGSIQISISGGSAPYQYQWADSGLNASTRSNLSGSLYYLTVSDVNGCSATSSFNVVPVSVTLFGVNPTCSKNDGDVLVPNSDGEIYTIVNGGTKPYTYLWSNGSTDENVKGLSNGYYTVTVSASNCVASEYKVLAGGSCTPPEANDDYLVTEINVPLEGNVGLNDYDPDFEYPLTILPLGYIEPEIGIIEWDSAYDGSFKYTPYPGFYGTFVVPYQTCDTLALCDEANLHITVSRPILGAAKTISSLPMNNGDQTYNFSYTVLVENMSYLDLGEIQVSDDLATTFSGSLGFEVLGVSSNDFSVNPNFDGSSEVNLLTGTDVLPSLAVGEITIYIKLNPGTKLGTYMNSAIVSCQSNGGLTYTDTSQDGFDPDPDNDGNPTNNNQPTPLLLCPVISLVGDDVICAGTITTLSQVPAGTWVSSNPSVAQVNNSGVVVGISAGTATFTFIEATSGCVTNPTEPVTVIAKPIVGLAGDSIVCSGYTTALFPTAGGSWSSSNSNIGTVTNNGIVTGKAAGRVSFYFTDFQTGCLSNATLDVIIKANPIPTFIGESTICEGTTTQVTPNTNGTWSSQNSIVATVTNGGLVTGISNGLTQLSFTTSEGCVSTASLPVLVQGGTPVSLCGPASICVGSNSGLKPETGGTWTSDDPDVALVTSNGVVIGISAGIASFRFVDSITGCVSVFNNAIQVYAKPEVQMPSESSVCIGQNIQLSPTFGGTWLSADPTIATVNQSGMVTGVSAGATTFTFLESAFGCVSDPTSSIVVMPKPLVGITGDLEICPATFTSLTSSEVGTWTSSAPSIATVNNNGEVTGISQGIVRFLFTSSNTGCISDFTENIIVNPKPNIAITGTTSVCQAATTTLYPNFGGTWSSSHPSIASITNQGVVTGIASGQATFVFVDSITGCPSNPSALVTIQAAPTIAITGPDAICAGSVTNLIPATGGVWNSTDTRVAIITNTGLATGLAAGQASFIFTSASTGCSSLTSSGLVTVNNCIKPDYNATFVNVSVAGNVQTNDEVPSNVLYGQQPVIVTKPDDSTPHLVMQNDGSYTFITDAVGTYIYNVAVCIPPVNIACPTSILQIHVTDLTKIGKVPIANMDLATTFTNQNPYLSGYPVKIPSLLNDACVFGVACTLDPQSVSILSLPENGSALLHQNGDINYTPFAGFSGIDKIQYRVCVEGEPDNCANAWQYIEVLNIAAFSFNATDANDDFYITNQETPVIGNVALNDFDYENDIQAVTIQGSELNPVDIFGGSYYLNANGDFSFTPDDGFYGMTSFVYTICDDNVVMACRQATAYIYVLNDITLQLRVYLEGSLHNNGNIKTASGRPLMKDQLRQNGFTGQCYIPSQDPYKFQTPNFDLRNKYPQVNNQMANRFSTIPNYAEVMGVTGENAIVDWVFVELRSKTDSTEIIATRSGLVQRDGDVVDLDGVSHLRIPGVAADSFFVAIRHRNHLGAMSEKVFSGDLIDFTSLDQPIFNFGSRLNNGYNYTGLSMNELIVPGYRALWGGDFDGDGKLKFVNPGDDQNVLFFEVFAYPENLVNTSNYNFAYGYLQGDYNMDGKSKYDNPNDDKNYLFSQILLYPLNTGLLANFNFFLQQIPKR